MTIITKCPHCNTTFNVADAILSKYKGLVRCASCSNVFNAIENEIKKSTQQAGVNQVRTASQNQQSSQSSQEKPQVAVKQAPAPAPNARPVEKASTPVPSSAQSSPKPASVSASSVNTESNARKQQLQQIKANKNPSDTDNDEENDGQSIQQSLQKITYRNIQQLNTKAVDDISDKAEKTSSITQSTMPVSISILEKITAKLTFLKFLNSKKSTEEKEDNTPRTLVGNTNLNKRLNDWGSSQKKRPIFILANVVLGTALMIQLLYWQKNNIANAMPSTAPALKLLAKVFGGQLAPLKLKDNPVVSFSDMQKDLSINANRYILNVGLQNRFAGEAAMPSLEISLFDLNEQIITRRVFHPQVFLKPSDWKRLETYGLRANEELPIKLRFETNQAISSFKVVVFYP